MKRLLVACLCICASGLAAAQEADRASIASQTANLANGRLAINQAAGAGNAQANLMAVATGRLADASATAVQWADNPVTARIAITEISPQAFAGLQGALALNQAAGSNTLQTNLLVVETRESLRTADDTALAQTVAIATPAEGAGSAPEVSREARIDASAFRGASGVLQVNQSAGVGNSAANAIVVRLPPMGASR